MDEKERKWILAQIANLEAMIANDPNGKEAKNWRQQVANLKSRLRF
jgi:hypothetical protein